MIVLQIQYHYVQLREDQVQMCSRQFICGEDRSIGRYSYWRKYKARNHSVFVYFRYFRLQMNDLIDSQPDLHFLAYSKVGFDR